MLGPDELATLWCGHRPQGPNCDSQSEAGAPFSVKTVKRPSRNQLNMFLLTAESQRWSCEETLPSAAHSRKHSLQLQPVRTGKAALTRHHESLVSLVLLVWLRLWWRSVDGLLRLQGDFHHLDAVVAGQIRPGQLRCVGIKLVELNLDAAQVPPVQQHLDRPVGAETHEEEAVTSVCCSSLSSLEKRSGIEPSGYVSDFVTAPLAPS